MDLIHLIILSIVQGVTEFLPISSSAHLVLLPQFMDWKDQGLAIDVAAHLGSLFALVFYFRKDFRIILVNGLTPIFAFNYTGKKYKLFWLVIFASIPALVVGFFFRDIISHYLRDPLVISFATIFFGLVLWVSDKAGKCHRAMETVSKRDAVLIGFSQILAFIPGTSRSGVTITAGLFLGLDRNTAVKFSFFMSVPIILAAALYEVSNLMQSGGSVDIPDFIITVLLSAISSFFTIHFFLKFVDKIGMFPFVIYRLILGAVLLYLFL